MRKKVSTKPPNEEKRYKPTIDRETGMHVYPEKGPMKIEYFPGIRISVNNKRAKRQLLKALKYIHDLECVDSNFVAVNCLMHMYLDPGAIEIREEE